MDSFLRHTEIHEPEQAISKTMFQVFVQDDEIFHEVLQVLAGMEPGSVAVVSGESSANYLSQLPLFTGFWTDDTRRYMHIILAVIDKGLTNETFRRIEEITGPLGQRRDILVTAQELLYSGGALGA